MQYNILIVDDDKNIRNGLMRTLEPKGYRVFLAENGLKAMDLLNIESFDLVLADLKMPHLNVRPIKQRFFQKA